MTVEDLITVASIGRINPTDVDRTATDACISTAEVLDAVARLVVDRYTAGVYDLRFCDGVMTEVFQYAYVNSSVGLSPFAWGVFEAFELGGFRGEQVTKALIAAVLKRGYLILGDADLPDV